MNIKKILSTNDKNPNAAFGSEKAKIHIRALFKLTKPPDAPEEHPRIKHGIVATEFQPQQATHTAFLSPNCLQPLYLFVGIDKYPFAISPTLNYRSSLMLIRPTCILWLLPDFPVAPLSVVYSSMKSTFTWRWNDSSSEMVVSVVAMPGMRRMPSKSVCMRCSLSTQ